jgi:alkanesulfonate monooxygenase SsuD/methylene tetrahydromethanopterin reductase-like flavin-dependent oxidoreductase (luciferase family)
MYASLAGICVDLAADDTIRAVVFQGTGSEAFVSGSDIRNVGEIRGLEDALAYEQHVERTIAAVERLAATVANDAHTRFIVTNDPDECVAAIEPYLGLGFTHLVFHLPGKDQERAMTLFAAEVLPLLRKRT